MRADRRVSRAGHRGLRADRKAPRADPGRAAAEPHTEVPEVPEVPEGIVRYLSTVEHPDTVEPHRTEAPVRTAGSWVRGAPGIRVVAAPVDTLAAEEPRTAVVETGSRAEPAPVAVHTPVEWAAAVSYTHLDVYKRQPQNVGRVDNLYILTGFN